MSIYDDHFIRVGQYGAGGVSSWNYSQFQDVAQSISTGMGQTAATTDENGNGNGFNFTDMINNPGGAFLVGLVLLGMSGFRG